MLRYEGRSNQMDIPTREKSSPQSSPESLASLIEEAENDVAMYPGVYTVVRVQLLRALLDHLIAGAGREKDAATGIGYVDFRNVRQWLVVRKRETDPPEVYAFDRYDEAAVFFDGAQQQWSDTFFCSVVCGPGDERPSLPASWFCAGAGRREALVTKWRERANLDESIAKCAGDDEALRTRSTSRAFATRECADQLTSLREDLT